METSITSIVKTIYEPGILPVFRTNDVRHLMKASLAYYDAGIRCVEYTLTMPGALGLIKQASKELPPDMIIGAGTILDPKDVAKTVKAGAKFIASPGFIPEIVRACRKLKVASVVGAITPTEIANALKCGANVIKVFPAGVVGPVFFSEILGPFPGICLMAAGGINIHNAGNFIRAGASVVTLLGNGLAAKAYTSGKCAPITRAAREFVQVVQKARADMC